MSGPRRYAEWLVPLMLVPLTAVAALFLTQRITRSTEPIPTIQSAAQPVATATPSPLGLSRENPLNGLEPIVLKNWDVRVLDIVRGPEAWKMIHDANQFNDPPPDGWSYLLIQYHLQRKGDNQDENSLGLHLTGNANILHYSFNTSVVPPEPILDVNLFGGEKSQGWDAYLIHDDESNLMLVLDDLSDYEEPEYFARLDEDASLTVPAALKDIVTTTIGLDINQPVPFGQMATNEDWQIMVQQVQEGDTAWATVQAGNQFNDPPATGQSYLLVQVSVHYIGSNPLGAWVNNSDFDVTNHDREFVSTTSVSGLEPDLSYVKLYPDGRYEGWLAFLVESKADFLLLTFMPGYVENENRRYLSLQQSGR